MPNSFPSLNADNLEQVADFILSCSSVLPGGEAIQRRQTLHRLRLVQSWNIAPGDRVLEVGCGQGDTTAALAVAVGPAGRLHAVDCAPGSYGAPVTLGEATARLQASAVGGPIHFSLGTDLLDERQGFAADEFDHIVFSHCAWYFPSLEAWTRLLQRVRPWGRRLCVAEWDARATSPGQWAHALAAMIQAQQEALAPLGEANIRCLFTPGDLAAAAITAGWNVAREQQLDSRHLDDGSWEIELALGQDTDRATEAGSTCQQLLASQRELLRWQAETYGRESLDTYALSAI